jgi:hypothetical protein
VPFDPATKGGMERSVAVAKGDLVPSSTNLVEEYASFGELQAACDAFITEINQKPHSVTRRTPVEMLADEHASLHAVPLYPYTVTLGLARKVPANMPMVTFEYGQYSVPYALLGQTVWVRRQSVKDAELIVIVHVGVDGPVEVARHALAAAGQPAVDDAHFPEESETVLQRSIRPVTHTETEFVALGSGAREWLRVAAAQGINRITHKMGYAVTLAQASDVTSVDRMLALAAQFHRFHTDDMDSILNTVAGRHPEPPETVAKESEQSLAQGTNPWTGFGVTTTSTGTPDTAHIVEEVAA